MSALRPTISSILALAFLAGNSLGEAESSEEPAPACSTPQVRQESWRSETLESCGIRLRLPARYKQKHWDVTVGDFVGASYRADNFDRIDINVLAAPDAAPERNKIHREIDHRGYSECLVTIGGRKAVMQSLRGGGVILDGGRSYPPFVVVASWQLRPDPVLQITFSGSTRQSQEEILAVLRTVQFL